MPANNSFEYGFAVDGNFIKDPKNSIVSGNNSQVTTGQDLNTDTAPPVFAGLTSAIDAVAGGKINLSWSAASDITDNISYFSINCFR